MSARLLTFCFGLFLSCCLMLGCNTAVDNTTIKKTAPEGNKDMVNKDDKANSTAMSPGKANIPPPPEKK